MSLFGLLVLGSNFLPWSLVVAAFWHSFARGLRQMRAGNSRLSFRSDRAFRPARRLNLLQILKLPYYATLERAKPKGTAKNLQGGKLTKHDKKQDQFGRSIGTRMTGR